MSGRTAVRVVAVFCWFGSAVQFAAVAWELGVAGLGALALAALGCTAGALLWSAATPTQPPGDQEGTE